MALPLFAPLVHLSDTTVKNLSPGTTAGDLDYYTSGTAKARLGIGTAGQVLKVNSGATAPEWATDASGMANPMTTTADIIYSSSGSTPDRLGIGTAGQVLAVNSGATAPEWVTPVSGKLCKAGQQLRLQVDDSYPDRDKSSTGGLAISLIRLILLTTILMQRGIVRAIDIDRDLSGKAKPDLMPYLADQIRRLQQSVEIRESLISSSQARLLPLAWGGAGASILESIRIISIAIFLSLRRAIQMIRSLISQ
jgi:hypothetical protein